MKKKNRTDLFQFEICMWFALRLQWCKSNFRTNRLEFKGWRQRTQANTNTTSNDERNKLTFLYPLLVPFWLFIHWLQYLVVNDSLFESLSFLRRYSSRKYLNSQKWDIILKVPRYSSEYLNQTLISHTEFKIFIQKRRQQNVFKWRNGIATH